MNRPMFRVGDAVIYRSELARVEQVHPAWCVIRELKSGWIARVSCEDLALAPGFLRSAEAHPPHGVKTADQPGGSRDSDDSSSAINDREPEDDSAGHRTDTPPPSGPAGPASAVPPPSPAS